MQQMKGFKWFSILLVIFVFFQADLFGQNNTIGGWPAFIQPPLNRITNTFELNGFFKKLQSLEKNKTGQINIVHIGDSHLQAGFFSGVIRAALQQRFGNAGRGIVFPYRLAKSNGPKDIVCSSSVNWDFNRLAHPEIPIATGISGFCLTKNNPVGTLSIKLPEDSFTNLEFYFLRNASAKNVLFKTATQASFLTLQSDTLSVAPIAINLSQAENEFNLLFSPVDGKSSISFFGVNATNNNPGIIYHSIGVNGARFDSFTKSDYFFNQLAFIPADLYIVSLGTNEAQNPALSGQELADNIEAFYEKIKAINPDAVMLFTTPASSFFRNKVINYKMEMVKSGIMDFATAHNMPYWNLFNISGGNSASSWRRANMMAIDGVHYNGAGYALQATLFVNAFMNAYDKFIE